LQACRIGSARDRRGGSSLDLTHRIISISQQGSLLRIVPETDHLVKQFRRGVMAPVDRQADNDVARSRPDCTRSQFMEVSGPRDVSNFARAFWFLQMLFELVARSQ
jgi:hypothetical protein